jgi:Mn-dependent DtxR family transcriptional regulator
MYIIWVVISNTNGSTIEEVSEKISLKPKYVESMLTFLSDLGILEEKYGRYYIHEEKKCFYEKIIKHMIWALEVLRGF